MLVYSDTPKLLALGHGLEWRLDQGRAEELFLCSMAISGWFQTSIASQHRFLVRVGHI